MSGANPTAEFLYHLELAALFALLTLGNGWTWASMLAGGPVGVLLRLLYDHRTAMRLGRVVVALIVALDTVRIGLDLADDPDFVSGVWPPYFLALVLVVCWLLHVSVGLVVLRIGVAVREMVVRGRAARSARAGDVSDRSQGPT